MCIRRFELNPDGRDFVVGDIHGHFSALEQAMDEVGFDPRRDRLFSVGDLVDRGPESRRAPEWLDYSWFHPVMGNHEDFVCHFDELDPAIFLLNGGEWFLRLEDAEKRRWAALFEQLPLAIEVETRKGRIGIVHADCPVRHWDELSTVVGNPDVREFLLYSRQRAGQGDTTPIGGVEAVVVGHTVMGRDPVRLGNVIHADTGGWMPGGRFSVLDLESLAG